MAGVDVSGQEMGRARVLMRSPLWPKEIGVSSHCRYEDTDVMTQSSRNSGGAPRHNRQNSRDRPADHCVLPDDSQGQLIHPFFFSSVYDHCHGNYEITTNHSSTNCTVDYIFYSESMSSKAGSPYKPLGTPNFTSNLSLVKRLTLFTDGEVRAMGGLPNVHWTSDHLSLQATLRLTTMD
ncbi:protein angel homolog 2-like [Strongylocentrotus purpuratus]|nr:protein angel homolog 2-like [Strongylocentrotus purpuratus]